jgi:hypothetical protein
VIRIHKQNLMQIHTYEFHIFKFWSWNLHSINKSLRKYRQEEETKTKRLGTLLYSVVLFLVSCLLLLFLCWSGKAIRNFTGKYGKCHKHVDSSKSSSCVYIFVKRKWLVKLDGDDVHTFLTIISMIRYTFF